MIKEKFILILLIISLMFQMCVYATDVGLDGNISSGETKPADNIVGGDSTEAGGEETPPEENNVIGGNVIGNEETPSTDNTLGGNTTGEETPPTDDNTVGGNNIDNSVSNEVNNNTSTEKPTKPNYETPSYEKKESENANLKSLSLEGIDIAPEFKYYTTDYTAIVGLDVENITVHADAEDSKATVTVKGNRELQEGENTITVTVEAEAGNTKTYTIVVTKTSNEQAMNAKLKSLIVQGFNIYPSFQGNIYNYNLNINEAIAKLEISVETENEKATFIIEGNEDLQEGENLIKIIVTAENGETVSEYKLNTYINSNIVKPQKESKLPAVILLVILGAIAIVVVGILIKKK